MTCSIVQIPGGGVAIVKHANPRYPRCGFCQKTRAATQLCDAEIAKTLGGTAITCDAPVCTVCALRVGELDYCPKHRAGK